LSAGNSALYGISVDSAGHLLCSNIRETFDELELGSDLSTLLGDLLLGSSTCLGGAMYTLSETLTGPTGRRRRHP